MLLIMPTLCMPVISDDLVMQQKFSAYGEFLPWGEFYGFLGGGGIKTMD